MSSILAGKQLVITGVITDQSIAYAVARRAQEEGAEIVLTGFGRGRRITERAARMLAVRPPVLELDVNDPDHLEQLAQNVCEHFEAVDGVLHAIAYAPPGALVDLFGTSAEDATSTFLTSAYSLSALVGALRPALAARAGIVALDFAPPLAWRNYMWMGVAKSALRSVAAALHTELGPLGARVNLVSAGPLWTSAAESIPGFGQEVEAWERQAPLGWDAHDPGPVADAICFLFSDLARGLGGVTLAVDGGMQGLGCPLPEVPVPVREAVRSAV